MYAAPVARVAYWATREGLKRVPAYVVRSARLKAQAWRVWGRRFAGVAGRSVASAAALLGGMAFIGGRKRPMGKPRGYRPIPRKRPAYKAGSKRPRDPVRAGGVVKRRRGMPPRPSRRSRPRTRVVQKGQDMVLAKSIARGRMARLTWGKFKKRLPGYIVRFQGMQKYNTIAATRDAAGIISGLTGVPGYFQVNFYSAGAAADSTLPCHIVNLTGIRNNSTYANVLYQVKMDDTGITKFSPMSGQNNLGTAGGTTWNMERLFGNQQEGLDNTTHARNEWYDIRMCLWGTGTQAVKWTIRYGYFTNVHADPTVETDSSAIPVVQRSKVQAFWQNLIAANVYHPQLPKPNPNGTGLWRSIWEKSYIIQPMSQDEVDSSPNHQMIRFFQKDGRVLRYTTRSDYITNDLNIDDGGWQVQEDAVTDYQTDPFSRARRYLLITATNTVDDTSSFLAIPSYDLCIRKKVTCIR